MAEQRAQRSGAGRGGPLFPAILGCRHQPGHQADRGAFDITFAPGNLSGETNVARVFEPQLPIEHQW